MAQLTVKPSSVSDDSFIFVNDQVLYVTQEVNLTKNPSATKEASIYLRNNGQLIQGGTISNNSGSGYLSAQQESPETNQWAYYYWCSPVGNPVDGTGNALAAGNVNFGVGSIYESLDGLTGTNARKVGTTPGQDGWLNPLTVSTRWLYTYPSTGTEQENKYVRMWGDYAAAPVDGFTMKGVGTAVPGSDQLYEFRGRPNTGNFSFTVAASVFNPMGPPIAQMTLKGNPYPSALDLNKVFHDPTNTGLGSFWYYDEDRTVASHYYRDKPFGYGVYIPGTEDNDSDPNNGPPGAEGVYSAAPFNIYNSGGNTGTGSGNGGADQNKRFAPIGQGIMFVGTGPLGSTSTVTIKNSHRVFFKEGTNSVFQRPEGDNSLSEVADSEISNNYTDTSVSLLPDNEIDNEDFRMPKTRLYVIFDGALTRDMVLAYSDQATDSYDRGLDGLSPLGLKSDAYFPVATGPENNLLPYVINTVNYDLYKKIPLTIKVDKQMKVEVRVVDEVKKPYENAYIFDNENSTFQQISGNNQARVTFNLSPGTYNNRFYIVFRIPNQGREESEGTIATKAILDNVSFFQNNPAGTLDVKNPEGYTIKTANVYDMGGKLVLSQSNIGDSRNFSFNTSNLSDGVYLVKLLTSDNVSIDYKTIVHNQ